MKKTKDGGLKQILKAGVLMLLLSLILLSTKLSFDSTFSTGSDKTEVSTIGNLVVEENVSNKDSWTRYVNEEYKISFSTPSFLTKNVSRNQGGYDYFIRFEENNVSSGKGIALGINKVPLGEELEKIKKEIISQNNASIVREEEIEIDAEKGVLFEFDPGEDSEAEKRSFLIVRKGDFTYSLSTVPEQIGKVVEGLDFLN